MVNLETLSFFDGLPAEPLEELAGDAQERTFRPGDLIVRQHEEANTIFILLSGHVQFLLRFEGVDDLLVGQTGVPGTLLGWSALRPPYRYTATVRCATSVAPYDSRVVGWTISSAAIRRSDTSS